MLCYVTFRQIRDDYKKFMRTVAQLLARDSGLQLDPSVRDNKIETFVNDAYDIEFQLANVSGPVYENVASFSLSSWCFVVVEWLFLAVPWGCLRFVTLVFPDHTHLLFLVLIAFGSSQGSYKTAHVRSLVRAFAIRRHQT